MSAPGRAPKPAQVGAVTAAHIDLAGIVAVTSAYAPTAGPNDVYPPGGYVPQAERLWYIEAALAGVELGCYDRRIIDWLAQWDDYTARLLVSLLVRVRRAAYDEATAGRRAGIDSESWTCRGCGGPMIGHRPPDDRCCECSSTSREAAP